MSSKLREALKQIEAYASSHGLWDVEVVAKTALAEPLLNCEVGTAEEQEERHYKFCASSIAKCGGVSTNDCIRCFARWSQMPYEEAKE